MHDNAVERENRFEKSAQLSRNILQSEDCRIFECGTQLRIS